MYNAVRQILAVPSRFYIEFLGKRNSVSVGDTVNKRGVLTG